MSRDDRLRLAFAVFGLLALVPAGAFPGAVYSDIAGVLGGLTLMASDVIRQRRRAEAGA